MAAVFDLLLTVSLSMSEECNAKSVEYSFKMVQSANPLSVILMCMTNNQKVLVIQPEVIIVLFLKIKSLLSVRSVPVRSPALSAQSLLLSLLPHALLWLFVWRGEGVVSFHLHLCGMFPGSLRSHGVSHLPG